MSAGPVPHRGDSVNPGPKAQIPKGQFAVPYAKRTKASVVTTETWWQRFATGPRTSELQAEAWKRHPGTDHTGVRLKIWSAE